MNEDKLRDLYNYLGSSVKGYWGDTTPEDFISSVSNRADFLSFSKHLGSEVGFFKTPSERDEFINEVYPLGPSPAKNRIPESPDFVDLIPSYEEGTDPISIATKRKNEIYGEKEAAEIAKRQQVQARVSTQSPYPGVTINAPENPKLTAGERGLLDIQAREEAWDELNLAPNWYTAEEERDFKYPGRSAESQRKREIVNQQFNIKTDGGNRVLVPTPKTLRKLDELGVGAKLPDEMFLTADEIMQADEIDGLDGEGLLRLKTYVGASDVIAAEDSFEAKNVKAATLQKQYEQIDPVILSSFQVLQDAAKAQKAGTLDEKLYNEVADAEAYLNHPRNVKAVRTAEIILDSAEELQGEMQAINDRYPQFQVIAKLNKSLQDARDIKQENTSWLGKAILGVGYSVAEAAPRLGEGLSSTYDAVAATLGNDKAEERQILRSEEFVDRGTVRDATVATRPLSERILDFKHGDQVYELAFNEEGEPTEVYNKEGNVARITFDQKKAIMDDARKQGVGRDAKMRQNWSAVWNAATDASSDLLGTIALAVPTGGLGAGAVASRMREFVPIMLQYTGRTAQEGLKAGLNTEQAMWYGLTGATMEGLTEIIFPFVGRITGRADAVALKAGLKRLALEGNVEGLKKLGTRELLKELVLAPLGEGAEESLAEVLQPAIDQGFNNYIGDELLEVENTSLRKMSEAFGLGAVISIIPGMVGGIKAKKRVQTDPYLSQSVFSIVNNWDKASPLFDEFKLDPTMRPILEATRARTIVDLEDDTLSEADKIKKVAAVFDHEKKKADAVKAASTVHAEEIQEDADKLGERADKILRGEEVADLDGVNENTETAQDPAQTDIIDANTRQSEGVSEGVNEGVNPLQDVDRLNTILEGTPAKVTTYEVRDISTLSEVKGVPVENELSEGMAENGMTPIIVDPSGQIIDGEHRVEVLKSKGITNVPVIVVEGFEELSDDQKMELMDDHNTFSENIKLSDLGTISTPTPQDVNQTLDNTNNTGESVDNVQQTDREFISPEHQQYSERVDNLSTDRQSDITKLSVGDYVYFPATSRRGAYAGFVKKINRKNLIIETGHSPNPSIFSTMELTFPKSEAGEFVKPKQQTDAVEREALPANNAAEVTNTVENDGENPTIVGNISQKEADSGKDLPISQDTAISVENNPPSKIRKVQTVSSPKDISAGDTVLFEGKDWKVVVKYKDGTFKLQAIDNFRQYADYVPIGEIEKVSIEDSSQIDRYLGDLQVSDTLLQPIPRKAFDLLVRRLKKALNVPVNLVNDTEARDLSVDAKRQETIDNSNGLFITRDGKPIGFDYNTDKVAMERFDISKLTRIGEGSDRVVFDLGDGKVLKVAKTARGLEQNIYEGDGYLDFVPEVYERGLNYVVAENIPRAKSKDVIDIYNEEGDVVDKSTVGELIRALNEVRPVYASDHTSQALVDVLTAYGLQDAMSYEVLWGDFAAIRNWGYKDGKAYHIDGGTFAGAKLITGHRGKKPLSDPEFREIYDKSRATKREYKDVDKYTKFLKTPRGIVYGFIKDDQVYLNTDRINANTPIHEFGHLWINVMKKLHPRMIAAGLSLVRNSPYVEAVRNNPAYDNLTEPQKEEEALAAAIGDKGEQILRAASKVKFMSWYRKFWIMLKAAMGRFAGRKLSEIPDHAMDHMTLDEFSALAVGELLGGKEIGGIEPTEGIQAQIVGEVAALQDNVARENLATAQEMEAAGKSQKTIWRATGWQRDKGDNKWKYEIDPEGLKVRGSIADWAKEIKIERGRQIESDIEDIIDYPELFKAYPQLRDAKVILRHPAESQGAIASYSSETNTFYIALTPKVNEKKTRLVLTHELQHAVQEYEGFQQGTSEDTELASVLREQYNGRPIGELGQEEQVKAKATATDRYRRNAGEVEARNATTRLGIGSNVRSRKPLDETAEISPNNRLFDDVQLMSRPDPKQTFLDRLRKDELGLRQKFTPEEIFSSRKDKFETLGISLQDIRDVYNESIPAPINKPVEFYTPPSEKGVPAPIPPKPTAESSKEETQSTLDSIFDPVVLLKDDDVKGLFLSGATLKSNGVAYAIGDFIADNPQDTTNLQWNVSNIAITGPAYEQKAKEQFGTEESKWIPPLIAYANSAPAGKKNLILTYLVDYLDLTINPDPALVMFVQKAWRRAGSESSEGLNARRGLRALRAARSGETLIKKTELLKKFEKDSEALNRAFEELNDADLHKFEYVEQTAPTAPTETKQARGKAKSAIIAKKPAGAQRKASVLALIHDLQKKVEC